MGAPALLARLRALPALSAVPIGGVLDLHGNISEALARQSNAFVAYQANPHTDAKAAAEQAAHLLDRLTRSGERAVTVFERVPLLLPPTPTGSADPPMRDLLAAARTIEREHADILAVNVFAGFAYADVPDAGVSFTAVTTGDQQVAQAALDKLGHIALSLRHCAKPQGLSLDEAMQRLGEHAGGPVLLVEPADNVGGGAPGDVTVVLRALIERQIPRAAAIINDPRAVSILADWSVGQSGPLTVGGGSGVAGAEPLHLHVELLARSDGRYVLEDAHSHQAISGREVDMGPCAVIRSADATILLTSKKTAPWDLGQWRSQGFNPEQFFAINIKAAFAHRQAYDPIAKASYTLNTSGPCPADLRALAFRRVRRPVFPLDEEHAH
jgi:microcystin degradation protein MlrC